MKLLYTTTFFLLLISAVSGQLQYTDGPLGAGYTRGIYAGNGVILAGVMNNLVRSTDGGESWEPVASVDAGISPDCFAENGTTIIMGTNNGDRTYRSTDLGQTWEPITSGMPNIMGFPSAVPTHAVSLDGRVFMGGTNFIRKTDNNGDSWETMDIDGLNYALSETQGELWAAPNGAIHYSLDGGDSWTSTEAVPTIGFGTSATCFAYSGDRLWVGTNMSGGQGLFYTTDMGATYENNNAISLVYDLLVHNDVIYCCAYDGLWSSSDDGDTWNQVAEFTVDDGGAGHMDVLGDDLWIATQAGPLKFDTQTQEAELAQLPTTQVSLVAVGNNTAMAITDNDLYVSGTMGGYDWQVLEDPLFNVAGFQFDQVFYDDGTFYVIGGDFFGNTVYFSEDNGLTWDELEIDESNPNPLCMLSYNPVIVATGSTNNTISSIWYSTDDGNTFTEANIIPENAFSFMTVSSFSNTGDAVTLSLNNGYAISNDAGANWEYFSNPYHDFSPAEVTGWTGRLVGLFSDAFTDPFTLAESTDGGDNWSELSDGFPEGGFPTNEQSLWKANGIIYTQISPLSDVEPGAIYMLEEGSNTWVNTGNSLAFLISEITSDDNGNLYYSTLGQGVWTSSQETAIENFRVVESLPVYPNPSNGVINIPSVVRGDEIHIYDSQGKFVKSALSSGSQQFDLSNLNTGLYHLVIPSRSTSHSVILK